jgi:hypothetical protein
MKKNKTKYVNDMVDGIFFKRPRPMINTNPIDF